MGIWKWFTQSWEEKKLRKIMGKDYNRYINGQFEPLDYLKYYLDTLGELFKNELFKICREIDKKEEEGIILSKGEKLFKNELDEFFNN